MLNNTMNVSNENYRGFTFEENNNLYDEFNFEKNVKDAPLYVFDFNKNSDANLNLNDNFMSVSPRQLFGGNFDCSPYIYNDKMMVFDSMDAVEEFCALPNKPNQKVYYTKGIQHEWSNQRFSSFKKEESNSFVINFGNDDIKADHNTSPESMMAAKSTILSHQMSSSDESNFKQMRSYNYMTTMKNSNEHINDESKLKLDMSNSFAVPKISNNKLEEKDEDCNRSSFDAQDTMKNSSDCSLSIGTKSAVSNEEMIQRLISNVIDKSGTQEAVDLAQRKDVVNKTILRIVRRFYIQSFKEMFAKKFKSKEAKSKWYYEYVKKFTAEIFGSANPDLHILQTYLASIINPKHMTSQDIKETGLESEKFFTFHNCLYKYSHTRLVNLFEVKPLAILYNYFYNHSSMTEIIRSEPSVNKNFEIYISAVGDFSRIFNAMGETFSLSFN